MNSIEEEMLAVRLRKRDVETDEMLIIQKPASFKKKKQLENTLLSSKNDLKLEIGKGKNSDGPEVDHKAATKLQKAYRSYRTRRNLADCAVVVEELWWKALDFAALRRSSISFFESTRSETAISRWVRARTRVAKLGKGLSKDDKAQKLAIRHWLEAIDPRHRYGHNLHLYYEVWFGSESSQPFFYWLDVGDGKEVNLETCSRTKLQCQCIKYLGPKEREEYEIIVVDGKLVYKQSGKALETEEGSKWIFVLSASRSFYVGKKEKGLFQHSSFLSGAAAVAAGRLIAHNGYLQAIWYYSGHYRPTEDNFLELISFLEEKNVDLTDVKKCPMDDDIPPTKSSGDEEEPNLECMKNTQKKIIASIEEDNSMAEKGREEAEAEAEIEVKKASLSCKWSSGLGARIGCVREYPTKLQLQALEQVKLSPKTINNNQFIFPTSSSSIATNCGPIPSPRPSPNIHLSPRLAYIGPLSSKHQLAN